MTFDHGTYESFGQNDVSPEAPELLEQSRFEAVRFVMGPSTWKIIPGRTDTWLIRHGDRFRP